MITSNGSEEKKQTGDKKKRLKFSARLKIKAIYQTTYLRYHSPTVRIIDRASTGVIIVIVHRGVALEAYWIMPTLLLFFSGALAQFLVPERASLSDDDDTNLHYDLYLLSVRIPFTLDGGVRTPTTSEGSTEATICIEKQHPASLSRPHPSARDSSLSANHTCTTSITLERPIGKIFHFLPIGPFFMMTS